MVKAWQLTAANEPLRRIDREDPQPGPGQVVVVVRAAGICHSDVGFLDGTLTGMLPKLPMVLGHEVAGVVSEIGPEVSGVEAGDRVVILGPQQHAPGWSADGGFADKVLAPRIRPRSHGNGDLTIHATRIGFDEIPDAIDRLKSGHVVGRIAAVMPDD